MFKPARLLLALAFSACFIACRKDKNAALQPISIPVDTAGIAVQIDSLPLKVGYSWTYELQQQDQIPDSKYYSVIQTSTVVITVISDTTVNGFHLYKLSSGGYYVSIPNGVYTIDNTAQANATYINDTAEMIAKYPANIGDMWTSKSNTIASYSEWSGYEKVNVAAGTFDCIEEDRAENDGAVSDNYYFSSKGVVRKVEKIQSGSAGPGKGPEISMSIMNLQSVNF